MKKETAYLRTTPEPPPGIGKLPSTSLITAAQDKAGTVSRSFTWMVAVFRKTTWKHTNGSHYQRSLRIWRRLLRG
jgi:hypothetical protein